MSNGQQAKASSAGPMRPGGVLVNFPAPHGLPPEMRTAEVPASDLLHCETCEELPIYGCGEMQWDDPSFSMPSRTTGGEPEPVVAVAQPDSAQVDESVAQPVAPNQPNPIQPKRNWLERWLFPDSSGQDKRSGARKPAPGLIAHFWTGGPPKSHPVRNISATGMYVVTEERWYLGTQILITLTKTLDDGPRAERSITVLATAVRWGADGVGLEFVRNTAKRARRQEALLSDGADGEQLGQFVEQFGATGDSGPGRRGTRKH
jgi:hypothetical protein